MIVGFTVFFGAVGFLIGGFTGAAWGAIVGLAILAWCAVTG